MRLPVHRTRLAAAAAGATLIVAGAIGGVAFSAPQGADGVIHACYKQSDLDTEGAAQLFLVNAGSACPAGLTQAIAWNEAGPQGPKGDPGTKGDTGEQGAPKPLLTKEKRDEILRQQKADAAQVKRIDASLDHLRDQLDNLDSDGQLQTIKLAAMMNRFARSTDQLAVLMRRLSEQQRELVKNAQ